MSSESNFTPTPLNPEPQASHDTAPNVSPMKPLTGEHEAAPDATTFASKATPPMASALSTMRSPLDATPSQCSLSRHASASLPPP